MCYTTPAEKTIGLCLKENFINDSNNPNLLIREFVSLL